MRRHDQIPVPKIKGWKKDIHPTYTIPKPILEQAILRSGLSIEDIKARMGAGFHKLNEALQGNRMDAYDVSFIESGLNIFGPTDVYAPPLK